jgi:hypothetical protein
MVTVVARSVTSSVWLRPSPKNSMTCATLAPSAIIAPNTAEKLCAGTPKNSAQAAYSRVRSSTVSPTSRTTARMPTRRVRP